MTETLTFKVGDGGSILPPPPEKKESNSAILKISSEDTTTQIRNYKVYDLIKENDPLLRTVSQEFDFKGKYKLGDPFTDSLYLAQSMFETMFYNKGIGMAAIQIGLPIRCITVGLDNNNKQVFFNPQITQISVDKHLDIEGCLSYNKLFLKIWRPTNITVKYQHVNGEWREGQYSGLTARIICHEIDHLDGKLYIDLIPKTTLMLAKEKRTKIQKKIDRQIKQLKRNAK